MALEDAAPCRHRGAPPDQLVEQVVHLLRTVLPASGEYLGANGLTPDEYGQAFQAAVERIRGSAAADNRERRDFAGLVVRHLASVKAIRGYDEPVYGKDTVYRLLLNDGTKVGLIQKGCPDGAHSATKWVRPEWADELYLWWLCPSLRYDPGEHIWKGVGRVRKKVSSEPQNQLDGIIFYNSLCGSPDRPCPKAAQSVELDGEKYPPPCVYIFPHWEERTREINWRGSTSRRFPGVLLRAFGIEERNLVDYLGYVGFRVSGADVRTDITCRFGPAMVTSARG